MPILHNCKCVSAQRESIFFSCTDILNHKWSALLMSIQKIFRQIYWGVTATQSFQYFTKLFLRLYLFLQAVSMIMKLQEAENILAHFKSVEGSEISTEIRCFFDIFNQDHSLTFSIRSVDGIRVFSFSITPSNKSCHAPSKGG